MIRDAVKKVQMQVTTPPEDVRDVLARIDAMLDELYTLRQTVQGWQETHTDTSLTPVKKSDTPITDSLFGAAGKGNWDEVYSNAEIVHMQFGEK